jgi:hypothetical protein
MKALQDRRHELLVESELNRQVLRLEFQQIQARVGQVRQSWRQHAWKWAAPIAGFLFARRFAKAGGFFAKGSLVVMLLGKLWNFWQSRRESPVES